MKRLMAIAFAAFALLGADGRDTAIYNGRLTSPMNANGMAITNAPTPVRDGDLVNKAYVDGISCVTPGTVTNIANARIDAKVAPWAMSGQPKPETDLSGITNLIVASSLAATNYTDNATNALAASYASQLSYASQSATNYTDAATNAATSFVKSNYLPLAGGHDYPLHNTLCFSNYGYAGLEFAGGEWFSFYNGDDTFYFRDNNGNISKLKTDNSPVVTSNMLNGVLTPALAQKADRAVPATANNFAALDAQGNLADSGCSPSSFAPAVEGGYLPRSAGENYPLTGPLYLNDSNCYLHGNNDSGGFLCIVANAIAFSDGSGPGTRSDIFPDGTPVMTLGQADFHIVTTSPVTSGQIGNFNITNLTAKTVSCSVSETSGKSSDILIWTYGNTAECQMTFTLPSGFTLVGDAADTKATANKKCLFSLVKISNTEVIVSKKEYN